MIPTAAHARKVSNDVSPTVNIINLVMIPAALVLLLLVLVDMRGDIRLWLTVAVFFLGAGSGITQWFRLPSAAMQLGVLVALSLAIDTLIGQALVQVHNISGDASTLLLAGITCIRPLRLSTNPRVPDAKEIP